MIWKCSKFTRRAAGVLSSGRWGAMMQALLGCARINKQRAAKPRARLPTWLPADALQPWQPWLRPSLARSRDSCLEVLPCIVCVCGGQFTHQRACACLDDVTTAKTERGLTQVGFRPDHDWRAVTQELVTGAYIISIIWRSSPWHVNMNNTQPVNRLKLSVTPNLNLKRWWIESTMLIRLRKSEVCEYDLERSESWLPESDLMKIP